MDRFFRRKLNKKGFTMVELIIVIAIIGILLAMIFPALFTTDKASKGKAYAESFYYNAQDFFARQRIVDDDGIIHAFTNYYIFYASTDSLGEIVETGWIPASMSGTAISTGADNFTAAEVAAGTYPDDFKALMAKFDAEMLSDTVESTDFIGTFYAGVSANYVVDCTYWADATYDELYTGDATLTFEDDNLLAGYTCCSYPVTLSSTISGNPVMFDF